MRISVTRIRGFRRLGLALPRLSLSLQPGLHSVRPYSRGATRGRISCCCGKLYSAHNLLFCQQYPIRRCVAGNGGVLSRLRQRSLIPRDGNPIVRRGCDCQHQGGRDQGLSGMGSTCKSLINVVKRNKPKVLVGLDQKVRGQVRVFPCNPTQTVVPPAERRTLTHPGTNAERGKPAASLDIGGSEPQGKPTGLRVWEDGASECRSVMGRIEIESRSSSGQHDLTRKRADFHLVSDHEIT
jgi:hypothetical protein